MTKVPTVSCAFCSFSASLLIWNRTLLAVSLPNFPSDDKTRVLENLKFSG